MVTPVGRMLRRGAVASCPVCGSRGIFRHVVHMEDRCPGCGLVFERTDGHWLGSWFLNICVSQIVVTVILFVGFVVTYPDVQVALMGGLAGLGAVMVPLAFFPSSRMLWTAIDLAMRPLDFDDGVAPGWVLEHVHGER